MAPMDPYIPGRPYRPATDADVPALTTLLDSITRVHLGRPTTELETRERLGVPGCDLATDSYLVPDPNGRLLAFGHVWLDPPADVRAFGRVHPDARGQGIGPMLAWLIITRARQLARTLSTEAVRFSTTAWAADEGAPAVLAAAGLAPVRHFQRLTRDLPDYLAEHAWPRGVTARPYRPTTDDDALFATYRDAFQEQWGSESPDPVRWWWDVRDSPDSGYNPDLWTVAEADGQIVGFVIARVRDREPAPEGYVSFLGVVPDHRGHRLGRALLSHQLAQFAARGLRRATLDVDVDNVTTALDLYRSAGMVAVPNFTIWAASLPGGSATEDRCDAAAQRGNPVDARDRRRLRDIVVDCSHPASLARFWAVVLDCPPPIWDEEDLGRLQERGIVDREADPVVFVTGDDDRMPRICFQQVPEAKTAKNRLHLDVNVTRAQLRTILAAGGRVASEHRGDPGEHRWVVMADPEGNEFCAVLVDA